MTVKKVFRTHNKKPNMSTQAPLGLHAANVTQRPSSASSAETIMLPRHIYESLIKDSEELAGLKALLGASGIEEGVFTPGAEPETFTDTGDRGALANSNFTSGLQTSLPTTKNNTGTDESIEKPCTVIIRARSPVTYAEVAAVVRGGALTQIFIKRSNKDALVSFVRTEDAAAFIAWAKGGNFRIQGKRAKVSWATNSWKPAAYIQSQVNAGKLTRNILIQRANSGVTEALIRKQLDHINNLEVLSVNINGDEVRVSTNCVAGAQFAKTCLMSRTMYKGMWIGFYPDECAEPLPTTPGPGYLFEPRSKAPVIRKGALYNPYDLLSEDDLLPGETGSEDESETEL